MDTESQERRAQNEREHIEGQVRRRAESITKHIHVLRERPQALKQQQRRLATLGVVRSAIGRIFPQ